nr:hypothetical protein B0A51_13078 [Rachicladosporium sp. CCFEE 5018]
MAAALAVLDLPELLENILLQLDSWKRPFVLVRVSRRFKATIEGSLRLQRKMWLLPSLEDVEFEMNLPCEHKAQFDSRKVVNVAWISNLREN